MVAQRSDVLGSTGDPPEAEGIVGRVASRFHAQSVIPPVMTKDSGIIEREGDLLSGAFRGWNDVQFPFGYPS